MLTIHSCLRISLVQDIVQLECSGSNDQSRCRQLSMMETNGLVVHKNVAELHSLTMELRQFCFRNSHVEPKYLRFCATSWRRDGILLMFDDRHAVRCNLFVLSVMLAHKSIRMIFLELHTTDLQMELHTTDLQMELRTTDLKMEVHKTNSVMAVQQRNL